MAEVILMQPPRRRGDRRRFQRDSYVHGQQAIANAIFHLKDDSAEDARAAVRFLMHHLATCFRSDDEPLQPRPIESEIDSGNVPESASGESVNS